MSADPPPNMYCYLMWWGWWISERILHQCMYLLGGPTILMAPIGHLDIPLHVGKGPMDQLSIKKGTRRGSKISNSQNGFIPIRKCHQLCSLKPLPGLCCASAPALSSSSSLPSTLCSHTYLHSLDYHLVSQKYLFYHVLGIELAIIHNVSWIKLPICFHA